MGEGQPGEGRRLAGEVARVGGCLRQVSRDRRQRRQHDGKGTRPGSVGCMIIVTAALKGGVGKTTTSVYLAALASSNRRIATLVDADPQGSAADWVEASDDEH